jgi:hypothetical protein
VERKANERDQRSATAYRSAFQLYAPVAWDIVERAQGDLLRLLIGKIPAELGVPAILGANVLFDDHPKAEQASYALLATTLQELDPRRGRTLLATLVDGWRSASRAPLERRPAIIKEDLQRTIRRLEVTELAATERQALGFLRDLLDEPPRAAAP